MLLEPTNENRMRDGSPSTGERRYDAFISYSHAVDGKLAPALRDALHQFAKPWYRRCNLNVFLDEASLGVNPGLWPSIQAALSDARHFVLLASPKAASSPWVAREIEFWRAERTLEGFLIGLTDGAIAWDSQATDFDWRSTTAIPKALAGLYGHEPRHLDLRWARQEDHLSLNHPDFRNCVADLAATLHGTLKEDLIGEDVRQHRRTIFLRNLVITGLAALTVALAVAGGIAVWQWQNAEAQRNAAIAALSQQETRAGHSTRGILIALEALPRRLSSSTEQHDAARALLDALLNQRERLVLQGHEGWLRSAVFDPSGTTVLTASLDGTAVIWDVEPGAMRHALRGHGGRIWSAAFDPKGSSVVTASEDGTARLWDAETGKTTAILQGHEGEIHSAAFGPKGARVVTASADATARIWDAGSGTDLIVLGGHREGVRDASSPPTALWW